MNRKAMVLTLIAVGAVLIAGFAHADKPASPGNKGKHKAEEGISISADIGGSAHLYFTDERVRLIMDYYSNARSSNSCPPGLAKKGNGCRPPGLARKWKMGAPLPDDVVYYDIPDTLSVRLGRTPEGHKIVRVGTDLLLIAVGTGLVVDAIKDLDEVF